MVETRLVPVKRDAHDEHRPAVLDRCHPPRAEAAAVAYLLYAVDDGDLGVATEQEIGMERMGNARRFHGAHGSHQGLAENLPPKHALPGLLRAAATEEVNLQPLEVQNGEQAVDRCRRAGLG